MFKRLRHGDKKLMMDPISDILFSYTISLEIVDQLKQNPLIEKNLEIQWTRQQSLCDLINLILVI